MLVPEPDNPEDHDAVAIYLEGRKVGHLAASISPQVQPVLFAFARSHNGHFVACPGRVYQLGFGPEVVLFLDTEPLGLAPEIFDHVPDLDRVLLQMIDKLDLPAPQMTGCDSAARQALAAADALWTEIDADFDRSPRAWPRAEGDFREVARRFENSGDPLVSDAWAGVARSVRYQKGRRDDRIAAAVIALYWNRSNKDAWAELIDLASAAPHEAENDKPSIRKLANDARKHADQTGNHRGPYPLRWTPGLAARFVGRARNGFDTPLVYAGVQVAFGSFRH